MPAAMTSAAPTPLRERTCVRSRRSSSGAGGCSGASTAVGRSDERHSSAAPAASSTTGHTITSENQIPSARIVSRKASVTRPIADGDLDRAAAAGQAAASTRSGRRASSAGSEHPREPVEHDPHAARRGRRHEHDADDERVDAEVAADAGAHAADEPVRVVAAQGLAARRGGGGGAHRRRRSCQPPRAVSRGASSPAASSTSPTRKHASGADGREAEVDRVERVGQQHGAEDDEPEARDEGRAGRGGGRSCARLVARRAVPVLVLVVMDDEGADPDVAVDHDARSALRRAALVAPVGVDAAAVAVEDGRAADADVVVASTRTRRAGRAARLAPTPRRILMR